MLSSNEYENRVLLGDCLERLKELPDGIADMCVTSPPYYGLRDYGTGKWIGGDPNCPHKRLSKFNKDMNTGQIQEGLIGNIGDAIYKTVCPLCGAVREDKQIGLEETPEEYIDKLVKVFREVGRVLKNDGTLWVNIGDSYAAQRGGIYQPAETLAGGINGKTTDGEKVNRGRAEGYNPTRNASAIGLKHKDLIGIPWMLAFALRKDGWYLRQDIIWHKPNPMPESVKDRCTKSHEYIFLLSKQPHYYFDNQAIKEPTKEVSVKRAEYGLHTNYPEGLNGHIETEKMGMRFSPPEANKRDVWSIPPANVKEAHFATMPEKLAETCIKAGSRKGGIVLDPFFGSGTTGRVAIALDRMYVGCELNPEYIEISNRRTDNVQMRLF